MGGHADHIAQASRIRIVTDTPLPMQVDGEPVLLTQSEILIEKKNQASMIAVANEEQSVTSSVISSLVILR